MSSPLETFAGLLDRSVQEIAALAADARTFDGMRIGRIADIWDNNTYPLARAACAIRPLRRRQARIGLHWMADLGAARRELMVDLDPALDNMLPAAAPDRFVSRDYLGRVNAWSRPVTAEVAAGLGIDYDLAGASVRSLSVRPADAGLQVQMTVAAPRRFTPSTGCVAPDGSRQPWPAAPLHFTFLGVCGVRFDAEDRVGVTVTCGDDGLDVAIGDGGAIQAASASVWPDDPMWHESAAGRAADAVTPHSQPKRRKPARGSLLTPQTVSAVRALHDLMIQIRLVHYYPKMAATIPIAEICRIAEGAGSAILAAGAKRGAGRRKAFAELAQRWGQVPPRIAPAAIPSGPAMLRYVSYTEPHEEHFADRPGSATLLTGVPNPDPSAPWRLAGEAIAQPARFRLNTTTFTGVHQIRREAGALTAGDALSIHPADG